MKSKNVFCGLTIALLSICALSCTEQTVKVKSLNYADRGFLAPADTTKGALSVSIQVEMPNAYAQPNVLDAIRNVLVINMFGKEYLNMPIDSVPLKYYNALVEDFKNNNDPDLDVFAQNGVPLPIDYYNNLEGFTLLNDPNIYSYGFNRETYYGGAQGVKSSSYLNFDLKDGHLISESNLFSAGYEKELIALLKKGIMEQNEQKDLEQSPYWTDSIKPNGNFYISDEGITYVFNPYEIAPNYVGKTEVLLPYADIVGLLKQGNPIAYLVNNGKIEE
jgi:hypothetical protein